MALLPSLVDEPSLICANDRSSVRAASVLRDPSRALGHSAGAEREPTRNSPLLSHPIMIRSLGVS